MIDKLIALCIIVATVLISAVAPDPAPMAVSVPAAPVEAPAAPVEAPAVDVVRGCLYGDCVTTTAVVTPLCPNDDAHNDDIPCVWWGSVSGDGIGERSFWSDGDNDSPRVVFVDILEDGTYRENFCRTDIECYELTGETFGE